MRHCFLLTAIALFLAFPANEAEAQVSFGPQAVLFDFEDFGVGARADIGLGDVFGVAEGPMAALFASVNGSYIFNSVDDVTTLAFNANAAVPFATETAATPFAGAGVNHVRSSGGGFSAGNSGLNILGGLFFDLGATPAFAELQYSTTGDGFLTLSAGVLFGGS